MPRDASQWREQSHEVGNALIDVVPPGWRRIELVSRLNVDVEDFVLTVLMEDGSRPAIAVPDGVAPAIRGMRKAFHQPEDGTWFSMRYLLDAPGRVQTLFNLDWDPRWSPAIDPAGWVRDLDAFPREPENIQPWLRTLLAGAGRPVPEDIPVARPDAPLDPEGQNWYWQQIGNIVAMSVPPDWAQVMLTYRAIGDHVELPVMVRRVTDGGLYLWEPPAEVGELLAELRAGMFREGRGTWFQVVAHIALNSSAEYTYTWDDEPSWDEPRPVDEFPRELARFPRTGEALPGWLAEAVGTAGAATLAGAADPEAAAKDALRAAEDAAAELEIAPARYRIGEIADGAWCLVPEGDGWAVFWAQGEDRLELATFPSAVAAVRYFTGHLYLNRAAFRDELPPDAKRATAEWPIQPLGGDVGLQMYGGKRLVTLPPGTELDRYGEPAGNTLYAARTEWENRSEPAEIRDWAFHVYRLRRPVRALTGTVIAWYDQPGGGTAYVLERSVADLLADGALEEIPQATTRPPEPGQGR
ncbi:TNT domain-containing protein [Amycolatopsis sp. RTGN1]|uniref:TNT domain-containing protein n=1 Tax=Amycolatopsis ponsaeliensis TaxID=2992142 RepID=UPI00254D5B7A|nr:TNT domain-containing protein [Amycolatopsis sp. RTGN1]